MCSVVFYTNIVSVQRRISGEKQRTGKTTGNQRENHLVKTSRPPTYVARGCIERILSSGIARMSSDRMTKSASLPASIEPFTVSSKVRKALLMVETRRASSRAVDRTSGFNRPRRIYNLRFRGLRQLRSGITRLVNPGRDHLAGSDVEGYVPCCESAKRFCTEISTPEVLRTWK